MSSSNRHLIFSDESGWDADNRFGSLAKISGSFENLRELNEILKGILGKHSKTEIKFKDIKNHRAKEIAIEFFDIGFNFLKTSRMKAHILVWDKHDTRHKIIGRCDVENLKRMYYHNMKVLKSHWNIETIWEFYPDEFTGIDWQEDVISYIENTDLNKNELQKDLFDAFSNIRFPRVGKVKELNSKSMPLIQLADLYAGIVRTSRSESEKFIKWRSIISMQNQPSLFEKTLEVDISKSQLPKFETMNEFKRKADDLKMGISLSESKYFKTHSKKNNIFIWHYEPQGDFDKAPKRL